jgi:hypothetical protein
MRSTINAAEHAAAATTGSFLSFKARTIATTNPIIAEIRAIVEPFSVEALAVISDVELKISGKIIAERRANGIYLNSAIRKGLSSRFLMRSKGTARNRYVINAEISTA